MWQSQVSWFALSVLLVGCAGSDGPDDARGAESSSAASSDGQSGGPLPLFRGDASEQEMVIRSLIACERFRSDVGLELHISLPDRAKEVRAWEGPCRHGGSPCGPPADRFTVAPVTTPSGTEWELRLRYEEAPVNKHHATYRVVFATTTSATGEELMYVRALVGESRTLTSDGGCATK